MTEQSDTHCQDLVAVDGHVHFHRRFGAGEFLSSAVSNLRRLAETAADSKLSCFVLALVDPHDEDGFERLCEDVSGLRQSRTDGRTWLLHETEETASARFESDGLTVVAIRGRQIRTAEDLEVLAIGTDAHLEDNLPVRQSLKAVAAAGAVPVIPWGFGKWFGRRGKILRNLLGTSEPADFFLGDNSNRLAGAPPPYLFSRARALGFRILPGSDPLPFPEACRSVGRAGFVFPRPLDLLHPARDLTLRLADVGTTVQPFVELESPSRFLRNQLMMQRNKRFRRSSK